MANLNQLADFLVGSEETHGAFVDQLFHNLIKQPIRAHGLQTPDDLRSSFAKSQLNVRELMIEIAVRAAMASTHSVTAEK